MVAIISVILILVTTIAYIAPDAVFAEDEKEQEKGQTKQKEQTEEVKLPETTASSYMVMSGSTSEKVAMKHADRKMQPGKITQLMTAMVVIDNMHSDSEFDNTVDIGEKLASYGGTFRQGESISVRDLMNAMLVGGDEQAAEALASYSASKRKIFINEMNSKCMALGLMDTQFKNPSGAYSTKQYSTASDLAVIMQAALRYREIKDALGLTSVSITAMSGKEPREMEMASTDPLLAKDEKGYEYITGGMMGTVGAPAPGTQFAAAATKDDMLMIAILMDSEEGKAAAEAKALLEYGDSAATKNRIVKKGVVKGHARIKGGSYTRVAAYTETKGYAYVPPEGSDSLIQTEVVMFRDLEAPMKKGDKVGEFRIYVADELKGTVDLIIKQDVPEGWFLSRYYISNAASIVIGAVLLLLLLFALRVEHVKRRRAKRREAIRRAKIRELARKQLEIEEDRRRRDWKASGYEEMPPRASGPRREKDR